MSAIFLKNTWGLQQRCTNASYLHAENQDTASGTINQTRTRLWKSRWTNGTLNAKGIQSASLASSGRKKQTFKPQQKPAQELVRLNTTSLTPAFIQRSKPAKKQHSQQQM
jgi:hypothetical protein